MSVLMKLPVTNIEHCKACLCDLSSLQQLCAPAVHKHGAWAPLLLVVLPGELISENTSLQPQMHMLIVLQQTTSCN